jgi:polysaccharide biosynthesis protein VpsM
MIPKHIKYYRLIAAGAMALSSGAFAQQAGQDPSAATVDAPSQYSPTGTAAAQAGGAAQRGGIPLGPITAYPSVQIGLQHNDNLYSSPNNQSSDRITVLNPAVRFEARQAANTYSLAMGSAIGRYQNHTADNYTGYNVNGLADLDLSARLRAQLRADYIDSIDPRGSTNNPLSATPDRWRQTAGLGIFSYGAPGARGRIDFELGETRREYTNNRETTAGSDRTVDDIGATFYWRVAPKTSLLFQGRHSKVDYTLSTSTLDSTETRLLAGATWEATAKTTGIVKVGVVKKDFSDATRGSFTGISWDGQMRWSPRSYSHVNFTLSKAPAETTGGVGNFIDRTSTGVQWTHDWSSQITTDASASYLTDAYKGVARTDNTQNYGLKVTYKMRRWLNFGGDYTHTFRNSDDDNFDYKRNVFMLFVRAAL